MKVLAIADVHGDKGLIKKIAKMADEEKVDLIVIAGDLTWFGQEVKGIISPFSKDKKVLVVHGNHDPNDLTAVLEEAYKNVINLHEKSYEREKVGFFGSGTTDWGFKEEGEQVFRELENAHKKVSHLDKKVLVTHCPPTGSAIELMGFPGSYGVRKAIQKFKPNFVICGHIHDGGGLVENIDGAKVINAARYPVIFEI